MNSEDQRVTDRSTVMERGLELALFDYTAAYKVVQVVPYGLTALRNRL